MEKKELLCYLETKAPFFYGISDQIWDAAETAFEEHRSMQILCDALEQEGFQVRRGVGGIETAFSGRFGTGRPVIGILGEFDALSGLSQTAGIGRQEPLVEGGNGHGCGHNMLGAGSLAAAVGVKKYLEETQSLGTVIYFGCPGEEGGSGKSFMAREGVFDELDAALSWHPDYQNLVWSGSTLANYQVSYRFKGVSAHAAANPHQGRSALDAVEVMNIGVQFLREHIIPEARIHYAITDTGGYSPNVVQANAEVLYLVRAPETPQVEEIYKRLNKIAQGAALITETEVEIDFIKACSNIIPNTVLEKLLSENIRAVPLPRYPPEEQAFAKTFADTVETPVNLFRKRLTGDGADAQTRETMMSRVNDPIYNFIFPYAPSDSILAGSTDVGDVSWICPTSQITTATWAAGTPAHSWQIVAQGKGPTAHKGLLFAGQVLAATAVELLRQPAVIEAAKMELDSRLGGKKYICPIPNAVQPRRISDL